MSTETIGVATSDPRPPFVRHMELAVASSPGAIWCTSNDHEECRHGFKSMCWLNKEGKERKHPWNLWTWSEARGLTGLPAAPAEAGDHFAIAKRAAKVGLVESVILFEEFSNIHPDPARASDPAKARLISVLVLEDMDLYWAFPEEARRIISVIRHFIEHGKKYNKVVIGLSHIGGQPHEKLQPLFVPVPHGLPGPVELENLLRQRIPMTAIKPTVAEQRRILEAGKGLSRLQFDNAVCSSMMHKEGLIDPEHVWEFKTTLYSQEGLIEVHRGTKGFEAIGGQDGLKEIGRKIANYILRKPGVRIIEGIEPKGILLAGPPGTGKTLFATCLGYEVGLHTLIFDMGKIFGQYLGQSEAQLDIVLALFEALAPIIIVLDEIGRMMRTDSGPGSTGDSSGHGTESRIAAKVLTWLASDRRKGSFIIGTTNDPTAIQTLVRSGRFDMSFYVPLEMPVAHKAQIWDIYEEKVGVPQDNRARPDDTILTPAEIEQVCVNSLLLGDIPLVEAADTINHVKETMAATLAPLDDFGRKFLLSAETGKRFGVGEDDWPITRTRNVVPLDEDEE